MIGADPFLSHLLAAAVGFLIGVSGVLVFAVAVMPKPPTNGPVFTTRQGKLPK
jgi:hypothetical protein